jgi:hypothetical protein
MPTRPDQFPLLAAKKATAPDVAELFAALAVRAEALAKLEDELLETATRNRETRTGKKFQYSRRQEKFIAETDRDAEKALRDEELLVAGMDDAALLAGALSGEQFNLNLDEGKLRYWRDEDRPCVNRIVEFRKETIQLIQNFVDRSPLKQRILGIIPKSMRGPASPLARTAPNAK